MNKKQLAQFNTGRSDADYPVALYTETQLIAAQQRVAEACAKVCSAIDQQAAEVIRNGEWRKYL